MTAKNKMVAKFPEAAGEGLTAMGRRLLDDREALRQYRNETERPLQSAVNRAAHRLSQIEYQSMRKQLREQADARLDGRETYQAVIEWLDSIGLP